MGKVIPDGAGSNLHSYRTNINNNTLSAIFVMFSRFGWCWLCTYCPKPLGPE